jgi:hypothetical protein
MLGTPYDVPRRRAQAVFYCQKSNILILSVNKPEQNFKRTELKINERASNFGEQFPQIWQTD